MLSYLLHLSIFFVFFFWFFFRFRCLLNHRGIDAAPVNNTNAGEAPPNPGSCFFQ
jgi:hypothetical protein